MGTQPQPPIDMPDGTDLPDDDLVDEDPEEPTDYKGPLPEKPPGEEA